MRKRRPGNDVDVDKYKRAREEQREYTNGLMYHLTEVVTSMLDEEDNILIPTLDNLEAHVQTTPAYLQAAYEEMGALEKLLRLARLDRESVKATVKARILQKCENTQTKIPAEHVINSEIVLSPELREAEEAMAEIEAQIRVVEGMIAAINMKSTYIPGLQGAKNRMMPSQPDEAKKRKER